MKKLRLSPLLSALILIIVGVILVLYSGDALSTILRVVAAGLLVAKHPLSSVTERQYTDSVAANRHFLGGRIHLVVHHSSRSIVRHIFL